MRKLALIFVVLTLLPVAIFAELGVGGAALFKSPVLLGQSIDLSNQGVNQFSFGGDLRYKLDWFQAEGLLLYSAGDINSLNAYLDAGVALDLSIFRMSLGAGPDFNNNFGESNPIQAGLNAKVGCDVLLGKMSVGLTYILALDVGNDMVINADAGLLGAQVLFWL